jgi:glycosyltransferase involved in cell wall biosynthesis
VIRRRLFGESKGNWPARVANLLLFSAKVAWHVLRHRYGVVMAATTPPVLVARSASAAARLRGSRFVYHCQDIHPEITENAGLLSSRTLTSFLRWLDGATCRSASAIVVLSRDMAATISGSRGVESERVRIINNFELDSTSAEVALPAELEKPKRAFRVLFAGNIGYFQGLDTVIAAADRLRDRPGIELVFMGDGAGVERLKAQAGDLLGRTVKFVGRYPQSIAERALASADLGLISVDANVYRYAYPSKTMTYLKAGCPLLVVVETDSELAQLVRGRDLGVCSPPGDVQQLSEAIRGASETGPVTAERRQQVRLVGAELFSRDQALGKWSELFSELADS